MGDGVGPQTDAERVHLRAHYDYPGAGQLARRALAILQATDGTAVAARASAASQGARFELGGFILEDLLHDLPAAKASYRQALTLNAGSLRAQEALARIADSENQQQRIGARGGVK